MEHITLHEFLCKKTDVMELCVICEQGWIVCTAWIDSEDLFIGSIITRILERPVVGDAWGTITIAGPGEERREVPCHYIDI